MDDIELKRLQSRMISLEQHLINVLHLFQGIHSVFSNADMMKQWINIVSHPIKLDTSGLKRITDGFLEEVRKATNIVNECEALTDAKKLMQTLGEIKFIGKRLDGIEKQLESLKEKGVSKKIDLEFIVDGYKLHKDAPNKKEKLFQRQAEIANRYEAEEKLLATLTERESKVLIHRFGLLGEKEKTLKKTGEIFKISRERVRAIEAKALRKCLHKSRRALVKNITAIGLREAIGIMEDDDKDDM